MVFQWFEWQVISGVVFYDNCVVQCFVFEYCEVFGDMLRDIIVFVNCVILCVCYDEGNYMVIGVLIFGLVLQFRILKFLNLKLKMEFML